ncbi:MULTISPECIES: WhiB family transcriptional regulator [Streptomyces]|uniref:WhiB family transcriptional regulator n=1 Tax=Streptomyces ramulosus TaxID=47762 RepID=A0ABW1FLA4_9ACTN
MIRPALNRVVDSALFGDWEPLLNAAEGTPREKWGERAQCSASEPDQFFLDSDTPWVSPVEVRIKEKFALSAPMRVCRECPFSVSARCLVEALRQGDAFGIRGGLLASERSSLQRMWKLERPTEPAQMQAA